MDLERLGRQLRAVRVRHRLTQAELATRAGYSRRTIWALESGRAHRLRIGAIEAVIGAVGARVDIRLLWNGPELDRLFDAGHAAMSAAVKRQLERLGWVGKVEVSYSRYGERGRIDLLAWHPPSRSLLVVEVKTELVDVQELLGTLDVKTRLAPGVGRGIGWSAGPVVPAIVFPRAGRPAIGWLVSTPCSIGMPSAVVPRQPGSDGRWVRRAAFSG